MIFVAVMAGLMVGVIVGHYGELFFNSLKRWHQSRRKFTCDVCKKRKRRQVGYEPLSLDLDYGNSLVLPLNLFVCHNCVGEPNA